MVSASRRPQRMRQTTALLNPDYGVRSAYRQWSFRPVTRPAAGPGFFRQKRYLVSNPGPDKCAFAAIAVHTNATRRRRARLRAVRRFVGQGPKVSCSALSAFDRKPEQVTEASVKIRVFPIGQESQHRAAGSPCRVCRIRLSHTPPRIESCEPRSQQEVAHIIRNKDLAFGFIRVTPSPERGIIIWFLLKKITKSEWE